MDHQVDSRFQYYFEEKLSHVLELDSSVCENVNEDY